MIIQWIRKLLHLGEHSLTSFEIEHYQAFENAVEQGDVVVYVYSESTKGGSIVLKGSPFHNVTPTNLVSFYRLNRAQRRKLDAQIIEEKFKTA